MITVPRKLTQAMREAMASVPENGLGDRLQDLWDAAVAAWETEAKTMAIEASSRSFRPGETILDSGIYETTHGHRATLVKGEPAPPTPEKGETWVQVVDTNPEDGT